MSFLPVEKGMPVPQHQTFPFHEFFLPVQLELFTVPAFPSVLPQSHTHCIPSESHRSLPGCAADPKPVHRTGSFLQSSGMPRTFSGTPGTSALRGIPPLSAGLRHPGPQVPFLHHIRGPDKTLPRWDDAVQVPADCVYFPRSQSYLIPIGSSDIPASSHVAVRYSFPELRLYALLQKLSSTQSSQRFAMQMPDSMEVLHSSTFFAG